LLHLHYHLTSNLRLHFGLKLVLETSLEFVHVSTLCLLVFCLLAIFLCTFFFFLAVKNAFWLYVVANVCTALAVALNDFLHGVELFHRVLRFGVDGIPQLLFLLTLACQLLNEEFLFYYCFAVLLIGFLRTVATVWVVDFVLKTPRPYKLLVHLSIPEVVAPHISAVVLALQVEYVSLVLLG